MEWLILLACPLGMLAMMAVMGWAMGKGMGHGQNHAQPHSREDRQAPHSADVAPRA